MRYRQTDEHDERAIVGINQHSFVVLDEVCSVSVDGSELTVATRGGRQTWDMDSAEEAQRVAHLIFAHFKGYNLRDWDTFPEVEEIVSDLAELWPYDGASCRYCNGVEGKHSDGCVWQRATNWTAEDPT